MQALELAIAHHHADHHQQAQKWLDFATRRLQDWNPASAHYRVEIEVFRREAESLIRGTEEPQPKTVINEEKRSTPLQSPVN